ncbi:MAG TPA: response regulator, partial [Vicinamibacterales bacterium]|nr:response regulator [Vicinamibacterales bacterium]
SEELQSQRDELERTNQELEEKAALLAEQNARIEQKNTEVETARLELEEKAEQLALSSKYKSEFLANMSHELRTPLSSLLILAKLLADNQEGTLTEKQVEFAKTIYNAGSDLLELINDILDLSKVEAGKTDVDPQPVEPAALADYVQRNFSPVADQQELNFTVELAEGLPPAIVTDEQRLQQVLKNLLSNAFKFTERGTVTLTISPAPAGARFGGETLRSAESVVQFVVADTGIGISDDKLKLIFEAFQQADGTTSRRYGGTGLGLSISREIARLLGGEIRVESIPGKGSTFTLSLPLRAPEQERSHDSPRAEPTQLPGAVHGGPDFDPAAPRTKSAVGDDRAGIADGDRVVLIVEDDEDFARTELELARGRGFKGIVAVRGDEGIALAHTYRPDAIILDLKLPVQDGRQVLDSLKHHPDTRHIPVHIVSGANGIENGGVHDALRAGAVTVLQKPAEADDLNDQFSRIAAFVERGVRHLLVVDDDDDRRNAIVELIRTGRDVEITAVGSSEEALDALESDQRFDCMVLDLKLPKMSGFTLLDQVKDTERFQSLPVIVHTGSDLTRREETRLKRYAETTIVEDVRSPERLLDETALFLHRVESQLPAEKRRMPPQLHSAEDVFKGKRVLIADDDVR